MLDICVFLKDKRFFGGKFIILIVFIGVYLNKFFEIEFYSSYLRFIRCNKNKRIRYLKVVWSKV